MILAFALAAAVLFGCGAYLLLKRDLVRVVAGIMLISQCALVTIIGSSLSRGRAADRGAARRGRQRPTAPGAGADCAGHRPGHGGPAARPGPPGRRGLPYCERDELAAGEAELEAGLEAQRQADREEAS